MRRREFIAGISAAAWPLAVRAQQPTTPVIGYLSTNRAEAAARNMAAFREGLSKASYVEGRNIAIERWAEGQRDRVPALGFVINLKTAETLGLSVPPALLATADEVTE